MSVNARLALALLALGPDWHHPAAGAVQPGQPKQKADDPASVSGEPTEAWLEGAKEEPSGPGLPPPAGRAWPAGPTR